ncbi:Zinc finger MYND domain-containing protein 15 [Rhynchospora pubera]|uniref:Zinc finger MYND domain-containing protein 15 n=1 Tax=Rhynchospora pubera TaxID=906938 RepID=A0AAV8G320_9POAL|nr:Zinc finger MYND domain-containing protein 15 [Rhynchospora pubera]
MECAAKGIELTPCEPGPPTRRCGLCGAVSYCSTSHQRLHWEYHKEECGRFQEQMRKAPLISDFPFTFSDQLSFQGNCAFLESMRLHLKGMWKFECSCRFKFPSVDHSSDSWWLPSLLCPCTDPETPLKNPIKSWKEYYEWRRLPLHSPVAVLLHWPLTVYHSIQLCLSRSPLSEAGKNLHIHYLGPEREISQILVFSELAALLPGVNIHIEFVGPAVPLSRDGETRYFNKYAHCLDVDCSCKSSYDNSSQNSSSFKGTLTLKLRKGLYHDLYSDITMDTKPDIIVAPNAGIAAYSTWLPTLELIKGMGLPAVFTDYCEEAAYLASLCIGSVLGHTPEPIQVNPFRQPMPVEETALNLPCYSNCFIFGM